MTLLTVLVSVCEDLHCRNLSLENKTRPLRPQRVATSNCHARSHEETPRRPCRLPRAQTKPDISHCNASLKRFSAALPPNVGPRCAILPVCFFCPKFLRVELQESGQIKSFNIFQPGFLHKKITTKNNLDCRTNCFRTFFSSFAGKLQSIEFYWLSFYWLIIFGRSEPKTTTES